jgi:hypothetical protein
VRGRTDRSPEKETEFLDRLGVTANVTQSCEETKIPRRTVYEWREADPEFAAAWDKALETGSDALEDEAIRRAHHGTLKPVFHQGQECGAIREYSDTLMIFMLKARRPERFRERSSVEHSGGVDLRHVPIDDLRREFSELLGTVPAGEPEAGDKVARGKRGL